MDITFRRRRSFLVALACGIAVPHYEEIWAADFAHRDVEIVTVDDSDTTRRIIEGLQKRFPGAQVTIDLSKPLPPRRNPVYVAVGPAALRALVNKEIDGTIVSVFTSSQAYRSILESAPKRPNSVTAIYAEPSPADQMRLISAIYKRRVTVAVFISERTSYLLPTLRPAAAEAGLELNIEHVGADDNLNRALNRVSQAPVILAVPDTSIYNAENIRNILVTSYRHNQAVVGFSSALVNAGALATTYSSIEDIAAQIDELLDEFAGSGRLPAPQFPKYFSTVVNDSVARSLNLVIDDRVKKMARKPSARVS